MDKKNGSLCPCGSGIEYKRCCKIYHEGRLPEDALALMKSRYTAYSRCMADYIIKTTHPENPSFTLNTEEWKGSIESFSMNTNFLKLEIIEFVGGDDESFVTFKAHLKNNNKITSFIEKSRFVKKQGRWLYHSGDFS